ncbi:hypothetical protein [uncultured Salegentibacter sp.]|uniref:hypothetical protein n=1 Tax=uncultured Salegentibacter sp. TaxID=259320 RepID=UPI0025989CA2|nr:hypothetical protein [uncultured Salegentibacter sp.]
MGRRAFLFFYNLEELRGGGIGLASTVTPLYNAEISPAEYRGRFVNLTTIGRKIIMNTLGWKGRPYNFVKPIQTPEQTKSNLGDTTVLIVELSA